MLFRHVLPQERYTVIPATYKHWGPGQKEKVPGLSVGFQNHVLDTDQLQFEENWADEQQELVERHLMNHLDFGSKMTAIDAADLEAAVATAGTEKCMHHITIDGQGYSCEEHADPRRDDLYCERHGAEFDAAPERHPNRTQEAVV